MISGARTAISLVDLFSLSFFSFSFLVEENAYKYEEGVFMRAAWLVDGVVLALVFLHIVVWVDTMPVMAVGLAVSALMAVMALVAVMAVTSVRGNVVAAQAAVLGASTAAHLDLHPPPILRISVGVDVDIAFGINGARLCGRREDKGSLGQLDGTVRLCLPPAELPVWARSSSILADVIGRVQVREPQSSGGDAAMFVVSVRRRISHALFLHLLLFVVVEEAMQQQLVRVRFSDRRGETSTGRPCIRTRR